MCRSKLVGSCLAFALLAFSMPARAYDLSRFDPADSEKTERGFIHLHGALWAPTFGSFNTYHQLSLEFGAEVGFRIASIRGQHNLYIVAGGSYSPQTLDTNYIEDERYSDTALILGYAGIRYIPSALCTWDGTGCLFVEARVGLLWESTDDLTYDHGAPSGDFAFLPGVGYRLRFGPFHLGARADIAITGESDTDLAWLTLGGFVGAGW